MNKTITPTLETIERNWFLVDAKDKTLGRLATEIATVLSCLLYTSDAADE